MQTSSISSGADAIRARRLDLGLTQAQVAERAGISVRALRYIERGHVIPRRATAVLLGAALDLPPASIRGTDG